jgi:hypothetical protein
MVYVQVNGWNALVGEELRELLRVMLGAHKQDATPSSRCESLDQHLLHLGVFDLKDMVGHLDDGGVGLVNRVKDFVVEELGDELVHAVVERCAEQHALSVSRRG